jgi:hypothetical protein
LAFFPTLESQKLTRETTMNTYTSTQCPDNGQPPSCCDAVKNYLDTPTNLADPLSIALPAALDRPRRPLRVLLIGERQDVLATIQNLHKRGFADVGEWSIPLPYPQQNAVGQFIPRGLSHGVISVHTKYLS